MRRGRPILGAIAGFFFGLFVALDLLFFDVIPLDSAVLTIAPVVGLVLGIILGLWAPLGPKSVGPPPKPDSPFKPPPRPDAGITPPPAAPTATDT